MRRKGRIRSWGYFFAGRIGFEILKLVIKFKWMRGWVLWMRFGVASSFLLSDAVRCLLFAQRNAP